MGALCPAWMSVNAGLGGERGLCDPCAHRMSIEMSNNMLNISINISQSPKLFNLIKLIFGLGGVQPLSTA
jgi:hypothetical protein